MGFNETPYNGGIVVDFTLYIIAAILLLLCATTYFLLRYKTESKKIDSLINHDKGFKLGYETGWDQGVDYAERELNEGRTPFRYRDKED